MKILPAFKYILVLFLFTAVSCEEIVTDKTFPLEKEFTLRMNEPTASADGRYRIKITEINDSRCPELVQCVWQGELVIKGEWTDKNNKSAFEVHSVLKDQDKQPEGFTIRIIDAEPYPKYGTDTKPEELVITLLISENDGETPAFTHLMKGWELYSWPEGNDWKYSILPGTNRAKSYKEVTANKTTVAGKDSLKLMLDQFPANEYISWIVRVQGDGGNLALPDQATIDEIKNYASQKELELHVAN